MKKNNQKCNTFFIELLFFIYLFFFFVKSNLEKFVPSNSKNFCSSTEVDKLGII